MFVAGFMLGFILAAVFSFVWVKTLLNPPAFNQVMEKEKDLGDHKEVVSKLEEEVAALHTELLRFEEVMSNDNMVMFPSRGFRGGNAYESNHGSRKNRDLSDSENESYQKSRSLSGRENEGYQKNRNPARRENEKIITELRPAAVSDAPVKETGDVSTPYDQRQKKRSQVVYLWDNGRKANEIARETGLGQGEVELILSLRNKKNMEEFPDERLGLRSERLEVRS